MVWARDELDAKWSSFDRQTRKSESGKKSVSKLHAVIWQIVFLDKNSGCGRANFVPRWLRHSTARLSFFAAIPKRLCKISPPHPLFTRTERLIKGT